MKKVTTTTRTRRKGPMKLRFHHQALPPEYLNHYESQQQNQQLQIQENLRKQQQQQQQQSVPKKKTQTKVLAPPPVAVEKLNHDTKLNNNENIINWLQNVLDMQNNEEMKSVPKTRNIPMVLESPATNSQPTSSRTQSLSDLPYMGEMTLENMKPRRGRKPKKADICHLIYKNYGTVVPGSNPSSTTLASSKGKKAAAPIEDVKKKNLIIAAKKITKEIKVHQNEPLNLCIREKNEENSILISDDNDSNDFAMPTRVKNLIEPCENGSIDLEYSIPSPITLSSDLPAGNSVKSPPPSSSTSATTPASPGYVYWPSAGIFIHPMAFYYQKMMNNKLNNDSSASSSSSSLSSMMNQDSPTIWDQNLNDFDVPHMLKGEEGLSSPPVLAEMLKNTSLDSQREAHLSQSQKRKRSAIFIPPVQTESSTSPTNEVSICKFKFTGGAKPSLQEKKILSVDSGGNFRYYSGTGDKNMRGYEFFPRENLMQSSLACSSHTNAFLNATSEKIPLELLPPQINTDLNSKLLNLSPDITDAAKLYDGNFLSQRDMEKTCEERLLNRKKKSSCRSVQRAKLEKTFKEKGFLIQTQQLQSAEGATYCKFRQLKKFTRYLFRSWKDYLPVEDGLAALPNECQVANPSKSSAS